MPTPCIRGANSIIEVGKTNIGTLVLPNSEYFYGLLNRATQKKSMTAPQVTVTSATKRLRSKTTVLLVLVGHGRLSTQIHKLKVELTG